MVQKKFEIEKFHLASSNPSPTNILEPQTISHYLIPFLRLDVQKSKNVRTFLGIELKYIDLPLPNFDNTIGFYYPHPLTKLPVACFSC